MNTASLTAPRATASCVISGSELVVLLHRHESDVASQLSAERGWMVPAYTLPPNAERVKIMRALVKETLSREQTDRLPQDIVDACRTLDDKGATHRKERAEVKRGTGY